MKDEEYYDVLFKRLMALPMSEQSMILSGVFGGLQAHDTMGEPVARYLLEIIEKKVTENDLK